MKTKILFYLLLVVIMAASCKKKPLPDEKDDGLIQISNQQFTTDSMTLGGFESRPFEDIVECKGFIVPKTTGIARIGISTPGMIKSIYCNAGQMVSKGQVLLEISGNELIELQKDFAETASTLKRLKSEYERTKSLFEQNIGSEKEYIFSESEYTAARSKYLALKLKLEAIGLDAAKIENGTFFSHYAVRAPISGNITWFNLTIGQHVDQQSSLLEIIDNNQLQLKLSVYVIDLAKLKIGQKIKFRATGKNEDGLATLTEIGTTINEESKAVECYGRIDQITAAEKVNNSFINARIILDTTVAPSLPESALIKSENDYFFLVLEKKNNGSYFFRKVKAEIGRQGKGFFEILNKELSGSILTGGAYNIVVE